jgi:outer membrane cobalamin receptor
MPHRPNKRAGRGLPLILLQLLLCGSAFAVEPKPDSAGADADEANSGPVETIVVTASRLLMPESSLTSSVNVITSDEIESRNTSSATDLLRQLPGVNVTQQGGRGGVSSVIVRGGESNFTTVMIDGGFR